MIIQLTELTKEYILNNDVLISDKEKLKEKYKSFIEGDLKKYEMLKIKKEGYLVEWHGHDYNVSINIYKGLVLEHYGGYTKDFYIPDTNTVCGYCHEFDGNFNNIYKATIFYNLKDVLKFIKIIYETMKNKCESKIKKCNDALKTFTKQISFLNKQFKEANN